MTTITKKHFFDAFPLIGPCKQIVKIGNKVSVVERAHTQGKNPSLSHLLFDAKNILHKEKNPEDRQRLFSIIKDIYQNGNRDHCFLINLIFRIRNLLLGRGFCTPQHIFKKILLLNEYEPQQQPLINDEVPDLTFQHTPVAEKPEPQVDSTSEVEIPKDESSEEIGLQTNQKLTLILPNDEVPDLTFQHTPVAEKPEPQVDSTSEVEIPNDKSSEEIGLQTNQNLKLISHFNEFILKPTDLIFPKLSDEERKAVLIDLFKGERRSMQFLINCMIEINSVAEDISKIGLYSLVSEQLPFTKGFMSNWKDGNEDSLQTKAMIDFTLFFIKEGSKNTFLLTRFYTVDPLFISYVLVHKFNMTTLSPDGQKQFLTWLKHIDPYHSTLVPLISPCFHEMTWDRAKELFIKSKDNLKELKELFAYLHKMPKIDFTQFGHNFAEALKLLSTNEIALLANRENDFFQLNIPCPYQKMQLIFKSLNKQQLEAFIDSTFANANTLPDEKIGPVFYRILTGIFCANKDERDDFYLRLTKLLGETRISTAYQSLVNDLQCPIYYLPFIRWVKSQDQTTSSNS